MTASAGAAYPPAPWELRGWGVATLQPVSLAAAQRVVPTGVRVVPVWPGRTVGGLLFLAYGAGSTLAYNELNLVAALVRFRGGLAFWLPRLYVDSAASLAGGREVWGVPKEFADFDVGRDAKRTTVVVSRDAQTVFRLRFATASPAVRLVLPLPAVGSRNGALLPFTGRLSARFAPVRVDVGIAANAEFAGLRLDRPMLGVRCDAVRLSVPPPRRSR